MSAEPEEFESKQWAFVAPDGYTVPYETLRNADLVVVGMEIIKHREGPAGKLKSVDELNELLSHYRTVTHP